MAYTQFNIEVPNPGSQSPKDGLDATRNNLAALAHALIMLGTLYGFNYSKSGGTADEPTTLFYKNGSLWFRVQLTWVSGQVTQSIYSYSVNSGGAYTTIGRKTIAYDSEGNVNTTNWSPT